MYKSYRRLMIALCFFSALKIAADSKMFFVEGNIGVGKSTFLKVISDCLPEVITVSEPCDEWQNVNGYNLLDAFYKDGSRWGCTFQLYALMTRVRKQQAYDGVDGTTQIMERSWFSDRYCFARNCKILGLMDEMEWQLYFGIWKWHVAKSPRPAGIIYLRSEPEVCYDRMKQRARSEESVVPLEYLKMLHERHEEWLIDNTYPDDVFIDIPVLVLDGSLNFRDDVEVQNKFIDEIKEFLKNHKNLDFTI